MHIRKGQRIGEASISNSEDYESANAFGTLEDFNLPEERPQVHALFSESDFPNLTPMQQKEVVELLDKYKDIFSAGPHDYGKAKGVSHLIDTGEAPPSRAKPY
jgi:hypothetical protein